MNVQELKKKANQIRNLILEMVIRDGGHIASSFSCTEILVVLYYGGILQIDPQNPEAENRDRFILSKGHAETVLYAILSDKGFFPRDWIVNCYRKGECRLGGHPDHKIPGVEITSGSLGHGLGISSGISLAAKMDGKDHYQYVLMGDAECTEGSVWEAALFAAKHELNNLIAIIDRNHIGSLDFIENYTRLDSLAEKWKSFGWETLQIDGHDFTQLRETLVGVKERSNNAPVVIIAETIKGKGVSFIENDPRWHVKSLTDEVQIQQARTELTWREDND